MYIVYRMDFLFTGNEKIRGIGIKIPALVKGKIKIHRYLLYRGIM